MHIELIYTCAMIYDSHVGAVLSFSLKIYPVVQKHSPYNLLTSTNEPDEIWLTE